MAVSGRALGLVHWHTEPDWHQHRFFRSDDPEVQVHVFAVGSEEGERMLAFRDRLRSDEAETFTVFAGFHDRDFEDARFSRSGAYVTFKLKFDQQNLAANTVVLPKQSVDLHARTDHDELGNACDDDDDAEEPDSTVGVGLGFATALTPATRRASTRCACA